MYNERDNMALLLNPNTQHMTTSIPVEDKDMVMILLIVMVSEVILQQPIRIQPLELFDRIKGKIEVFIV